MTNKYSRVPFDRIEFAPFGNVRKHFHGIAELADSIDKRGLLNPLTVWQKKAPGGGHFEVNGEKVFIRYYLIAGERRYRAIEKLRESDPKAFEDVQCTILTGTEDDARFAQIAENIDREDLSPTELMDGVVAMANRGHSQAEIAKRLSRTQGWVSRLLKVRENCVEEVREALNEGTITMESAYDISGLDQEKQLAAMIDHAHAKSNGGGKGAARKATRKAAGKTVRPGVKEIKERLEFYKESDAQSAPTYRKVLRWVLGEGEL